MQILTVNTSENKGLSADRRFAELDSIVTARVQLVPKAAKEKKSRDQDEPARDSEEKGKTKRRTRMKKNVGTQEMVKLEYFSLPLSKEITLAHIKVFLKNFKKGRVLEKKDLRELLGRFHDLMHGGGNSSAVQDIQVPEDGTVTVVGDTHGQLADLLTIFRLNGTYCCVWRSVWCSVVQSSVV